MNKPRSRNWFLVIFGSFLIVLGITIIAFAVVFRHDLGWWSLLIGLVGAFTIGDGLSAIIFNEPSFLLLDLIFNSNAI